MRTHVIGTLIVLFFSSSIIIAAQSPKKHRDYVPDEKTAKLIAEAVLGGQYGKDRVNAQLPLSARLIEKKAWLVEGTPKNPEMTGGNFGVWIDKYSGCLQVIERMK